MSTLNPKSVASAAAPSNMNSLTVFYNENEDRLVLLFGTADVKLRLLLTRRLTSGLINAMADVLAQFSTSAKQAPLDMRDSVVLFEHHEAVQAAANQKAAAGSAKAAPSKTTAPQLLPPMLVNVVDISKKDDRFALIFKVQEKPIAAFKVYLQEMHQVLDLLRSKSIAAQWALSIEAPWLDASASAQRMN
jgi:hypothetical protein